MITAPSGPPHLIDTAAMRQLLAQPTKIKCSQSPRSWPHAALANPLFSPFPQAAAPHWL
ncbi:MAG: hypothetical protein Q8P67_27140 [archaeon]|nr:hypothetical protein [archaeon]